MASKLPEYILWLASLGKGGVLDSVQEMTNTGPGVIGNIISLLGQGHHRLIRSLVVFDISGEREPTLWPIITEILDCLLQLRGQHVHCTSTKESIIQLPPGSVELKAQVELVNIDFCFGSLNNVLQFEEAS